MLYKISPLFDPVFLSVLEGNLSHSYLLLLAGEGNAGPRLLLPRLRHAAALRWCGVPFVDADADAVTHQPPHTDVKLPGSLKDADRAGVHQWLRGQLDVDGDGAGDSDGGGGGGHHPPLLDTDKCVAAAWKHVEHHVLFLPFVNHTTFHHVLQGLDVLLDPWPFGGGLLSHEAAALAGTPVVTLPSGIRSGRLTYAMLHRMGLAAAVCVCVCVYVCVCLCVSVCVCGDLLAVALWRPRELPWCRWCCCAMRCV